MEFKIYKKRRYFLRRSLLRGSYRAGLLELTVLGIGHFQGIVRDKGGRWLAIIAPRWFAEN